MFIRSIKYIFIDSYKKYVMLDPLGVVTKTRTSLEDDSTGLAAAPDTIQQREEMMRRSADNYFYMPGLGEVPELTVPDFLPFLAGRILICIHFIPVTVIWFPTDMLSNHLKNL